MSTSQITSLGRYAARRVTARSCSTALTSSLVVRAAEWLPVLGIFIFIVGAASRAVARDLDIPWPAAAQITLLAAGIAVFAAGVAATTVDTRARRLRRGRAFRDPQLLRAVEADRRTGRHSADGTLVVCHEQWTVRDGLDRVTARLVRYENGTWASVRRADIPETLAHIVPSTAKATATVSKTLTLSTRASHDKLAAMRLLAEQLTDHLRTGR